MSGADVCLSNSRSDRPMCVSRSDRPMRRRRRGCRSRRPRCSWRPRRPPRRSHPKSFSARSRTKSWRIGSLPWTGHTFERGPIEVWLSAHGHLARHEPVARKYNAHPKLLAAQPDRAFPGSSVEVGIMTRLPQGEKRLYSDTSHAYGIRCTDVLYATCKRTYATYSRT